MLNNIITLMDWNAEEVRSKPFQYYELENDSRNLSGYHVYTKCAFEGYREMEETQRLVYIMRTHDLNDDGIEEDDIADIIDSSDFQTRRVVRGVWQNMASDLKEAWKERANQLNSRVLVGQVEVLPDELANMDLHTLQDFVRTCIRKDLFLLSKMLKRALRNDNQRELSKKKVQFPYSIEINAQVFRTGTVSYMLGHLLFGKERRKLKEWELISQRGSDPFTYHICSRDRLHNVFTFQDLEMSLLQDHRDDETIYLCTYSVVRNSVGQSTKAYAISDTKHSVTMFFNEEREQARTIVFKKPVLDIRDGPPRQIVGYICDDNFVDGYQLIQFNPACLYLSYKNTSNFKLLASKMCVNRNHLIVAKKST